jgi:hypothetical protein
MNKFLLSSVAIAALALSANAQAFIPNNGFEFWSTTAGEDIQPTGWVSYNVFTFAPFETSGPNPTSVTQAGTPDNYQGNYSAKITTVDLVSNPSAADIPNRAGVMYTGSVAFSSPYLFPGYSSQQKPQTLTYYAKYSPVGGDSAYCAVVLTHWNGTNRDTLAYGVDGMTGTTTSYAQRTIALVYDPTFQNDFPDTISIGFSSSSIMSPQAGSALYVDDLQFTGYVGVNEITSNNGVSVYPNPSATTTQFDVTVDNASQVVVFDMTGREVARENFNGKVARVNSAQLANGSYTYTIISNEAEVVNRGEFAVAH